MYQQTLWIDFVAKEIFKEVQASDYVLEKALLALASQQTPDEIAAKATFHENNVGFQKKDANFYTNCALQLRAGSGISIAQRNCLRSTIGSYSRQLVILANEAKLHAKYDSKFSNWLNNIWE